MRLPSAWTVFFEVAGFRHPTYQPSFPGIGTQGVEDSPVFFVESESLRVRTVPGEVFSSGGSTIVLHNQWREWVKRVARARHGRIPRRPSSHRLGVEQLEDRNLLSASIQLSPASDTGPLNNDNYKSDNTPTFNGVANPGDMVDIQANSGSGFTSLGTAVANGTTGAWNFTVPSGMPSPTTCMT